MIYLDHAATSHPKPAAVVQAIQDFLLHVGANPGRSAHRLSAQAARLVFEARESLARLLGVSDSKQIVFTANATEALNLALHGMLGRGDQVITTSMEHNSVMRPLNHLKRERQLEVILVRADPAGRVDPAAIQKALTPRTRLVVVNHASNVVGTIQPIDRVKRAIGDVPLLVDAAQTAGCVPIQLERDGIDLLAFSGHKSLLGPPGTGGLYLHPKLKLPPLLRGGTGSRSESTEQPDFLPDLYESGTLNTCGIAGLGAGVRFILEQGVEKIRHQEMGLCARLLKELRQVNGIILYGPKQPEECLPTLSFNLQGKSPSEVARRLDSQYSIMVRVGLHCAPETHRTLGTFPEGTVRLSAGMTNTADELELVARALKEIAGR